jgi:predicted RNA-binding protein YlxR (DUF448 family)
VRIVRTPDGLVLFDSTGRLAGRGAYLCADGACWRLASTKRALDRALGTPLPPDIRAMLEAGGPIMTMIEGGARGQE